jgi:hypothetical protein
MLYSFPTRQHAFGKMMKANDIIVKQSNAATKPLKSSDKICFDTELGSYLPLMGFIFLYVNL